MQRPNLNKLTAEQLKYIEYLEAKIEGLSGNNFLRLVNECNEAAGIIADDVRWLRENGDDEEIDNKLQMLGSKKNKTYEKFLALVGNMKHFKSIYDMVQDFKPKEKQQEGELPIEESDGSVNMFEVISKKIKSKNA